MKTWFPSCTPRAVVGLLSFSLLGCLLLATVPVAGCGADESTSAEAAAALPFEVEVSELYVTVTNRSMQELTNVRVTIIPAGMLRFTASAARLDGRAKRTLSIRDFRAHDGSSIDLRLSRPKSVLIEVMDADGKAHTLQVPWKR